MDPADSISSDEPSVAARDSSDDSSDLNIVGSTGSAPSSNATKDSCDRQSYVPAGEPSSSIAKDSSDTSSDANNVVASSGKPSSSNANAVASSRDEPSSSASKGSTSSGRSVDVASGYTITENHDGSGLDINGIYEYHRVGNLYKISTGAITPESSKPTESLDTESSEKLEELPSTSDDVSSMPEELPSIPIDENQEKVDEAIRLVAEAEDCENQAKEAVEQVDRSVELLHETRRDMLLAEEIDRRCAKGEKIFLR